MLVRDSTGASGTGFYGPSASSIAEPTSALLVGFVLIGLCSVVRRTLRQHRRHRAIPDI